MSGTDTGCASRIVVGVDGSASSVTALRWALAQARLTGGVVTAVTVWRFPYGYEWVPDDGAGAVAFQAAAREQLDETLTTVRQEEPSVTVLPAVYFGQPGPVLVAAARGADLLVVGNRGRGGFAGALLGSVSTHCVHHAPCPVLVIRDASKRDAPPVPAQAAHRTDAPAPGADTATDPGAADPGGTGPDREGLASLSPMNLQDLALRRAFRRTDTAFFQELLRTDPVAQFVRDQPAPTSGPGSTVATPALVGAALRSGRAGIARALRPTYLDYLCRTNHGGDANDTDGCTGKAPSTTRRSTDDEAATLATGRSPGS